MILKKSLLVLASVGLVLFSFSSCRKESAFQNSRDAKELKGYKELLIQPSFVPELASRLDTTRFKYYDSIGNKKLWVSDLKSGTYGFKHSRVAISLENGQLNMIIVSYEYDESKYQEGDFSTFTGNVIVHNDRLQTTKTIYYNKGQVANPPCRNCVEMKPPDPPPTYPDWCLTMPALCDYQGGGGGNSPTDPNMSMPPGQGGTGGGNGAPGTTEVVMQDPASTTLMDDPSTYTAGGYDNTPYEDYQISLVWPAIANVIPKTDFVGVITGAENCMDLAKQQLAKKNNYQISEYGAAGQTIQVYTEAGGANVAKAKEGVGYLLNALARGIPVIVGVDNHAGSVNINTDNSTDHFIVIVGTDSDINGIFFRFYDSATNWQILGTHDNNKLYYDPTTGQIKGKSWTTYAQDPSKHDYIVTQIRKTKP